MLALKTPCFTVVALSFALAGCSKPDPQPAPEPLKPASQAKPGTAATEGVAAPTTAVPATAKAVAPAKPLPSGRSAIPTLAEWNAQQKEVTVKGSTALSCETKIVREYLRVSCRGKNDSGGTPTNVVIKKGGHGEALTFASGNVTSLIVPFVEGIHFAADFSWTDKSHLLTVKWPRGSKQPEVVGVFEGAHSPLDGTADAALAALGCKCHKEVNGLATCDELWGVNADCARSYPNNCHDLLACSRGEPGVWPSCKPGFLNGPFGFCHKACDSGTACGPDETCEGDPGSKMCM